MSRTKEQIEAEMAPLREELRRVEQRAERKRHQALVGRYFKYRNSYSSSDKWWMYAHVTGVRDWWPIGVKFQQTTNGTIEVELNDFPSLGSGRSDSGYTEITKAEFDREWRKLMAHIAKTYSPKRASR